MENSKEYEIVKENQNELIRFEAVFNITTEPSVFLFQYDTDIVRMDFQIKIDDFIKPKKSFILDCSTLNLDNLLFEINTIIKDIDIDLIHIINLESAIEKSPAFLLKLNTERDTIFRALPTHLVFWTNQFTTNILQKQAFDFWSWIVFIFIIQTPKSLLTERQKGFSNFINLEGNYFIEISSKDAHSRLMELERQWQLITINDKPTIKELKDIYTITKLYSEELIENGNFKTAKNVLKKAISFFFNTKLNSYVNYLESNLGLVYQDLGDFKQAKILLEKVLNYNTSNFGKLNPNLAISQSNLAMVYKDLGDYKQAKILLDKALNIEIINFGEFHPNVSIVESNLAVVYRNLGNLKKAEKLFEKTLNNNLLNFGESHPKIAIAQSNLALVFKDLGELEKAKKLCEKALNIDIINFGNFHPNVAISLSNLGSILLDLREYEKAKIMFENALTITEKSFGANSQQTLTIKNNLDILLSEIKEK